MSHNSAFSELSWPHCVDDCRYKAQHGGGGDGEDDQWSENPVGNVAAGEARTV